MNAKKRKEKDMKRGFMTNAERRVIEEEKRREREIRINKKYKKPL